MMGGVVEEEECFKKGAIVEVSLEDDGFRGSWYTATVLRKNNSNNKKKILVQFHTLMADEKGTKPLRESVDIILVRPVPPREATRSFQLSEEVDAFHNDGWWEGIVIDVIHPQDDAAATSGGSGGAKYSVFFRSSREQIVFAESELRLHREWVYGKWVPPLEVPQEDQQQQPPPMC